MNIAQDADATLVERVIARQAAHHVRADLADRGELAMVQALLVRGLEKLGDPAAAYQVAKAALDELPAGNHDDHQRAELLTAVLRLAPAHTSEDPQVEEAIELAKASGAVLGLEARVWAAVSMLNRPGPHDAALTLADHVAADLAGQPSLDATTSQWRLLLAFHACRAGYPALGQRLLTPVINRGTTGQQQAAQAILYATGGSQADTRLQIIILEAELAATPPGADDDLLHLHSTLAADYATLGGYQDALEHGTQEATLRHHIQGPNHRQTLHARANIAAWTGQCGDWTEALRLSRELLPDQVRMLGPDHPDTLTTRNNIAFSTGRCGDSGEALRLFRELLPDRMRVLGPDHPATLLTRNNIAAWTGECGDWAEALRLSRELLPDRVRVLGPDDSDTLTTRNNIAFSSGQCGDGDKALRLSVELLPDLVRELGPDHPDTLAIRASIAFWSGECGDRAEALPAVRGAAARSGAGAGPQPPRHPDHPQQHRRLDRPVWGQRWGPCGCSGSCCPTRCGVLGPPPSRMPSE